MRTKSRLAMQLAAFAVAAATAWAGPPAICRPIDIGASKSLPWSTGADFKQVDPNYDIKRLIPDTLALLAPEMPVKVRMETMRRAALYCVKDARLARELSGQLLARTRAAAPGAMAWFDAGYFIETLRQAALVYKYDMLSPEEKRQWAIREDLVKVDGVPLVRKALDLSGGNPDIRHALSLIDYDGARKPPVVASK